LVNVGSLWVRGQWHFFIKVFMTKNMKKTRLKGGSLSGTYLCTPEGGDPFVRKDVSLVENREYGFQRWYSQLKRLQRYGVMFPGLFPKLIDYGRDGDLAYFNIEFFDGAQTVHEFVSQTSNTQLIDEMFAQLVLVMHEMHKTKLVSFEPSYALYIYEEVEQKINACMQNARFREFSNYPEVIFNGKKVAGLKHVMNEYVDMFRAVYKNPTETFTHGNLTLENILYQPLNKRIIFIDPYEENIIDSSLAEYSQILQSSNSYYELYNSETAHIKGNEVSLRLNIPNGLKYFNEIFNSFIEKTLSSDQIKVVRLLEISQFARMLPFKMEIDEDKMLFFYALGSYLFHELKMDWDK
jgi:hypothetical protein